jgi:hypothetical protein
VQCAGLAHLFKFTPQATHALADHSAVGLDLRLTRTAEKAKTTALPLKVSPRAHEAALLVVEVRKFDLQTPFRSGGAFAENLEYQPGAVYHLALELVLQITLLDWCQRAVDDDELALILFTPQADILDLTRTEEGIRLHLSHRQYRRMLNDHADGKRKPLGFG